MTDKYYSRQIIKSVYGYSFLERNLGRGDMENFVHPNPYKDYCLELSDIHKCKFVDYGMKGSFHTCSEACRFSVEYSKVDQELPSDFFAIELSSGKQFIKLGSNEYIM